MVNRTSHLTNETDSSLEERLKQLAKFQTNILRHALSFPAVQKVVYSTCSVHEEENEQVVGEILSLFKDRFELLNIEPDWPYRGFKGHKHAQYCLRMSHDSSLTNGFFVACFIRKKLPVENNGDIIQCRSDFTSSLGPVLDVTVDDSKLGERKKRKKRKHSKSNQTEVVLNKTSKLSDDKSEQKKNLVSINSQDISQNFKCKNFGSPGNHQTSSPNKNVDLGLHADKSRIKATSDTRVKTKKKKKRLKEKRRKPLCLQPIPTQ